MKKLIMMLSAVVAAVTSAWADTHDYSVTNQAYGHNQLNSNGAVTLTLPAITGAPAETEVTVSEIILGTAGDSNGGYYPRYIEINGVKSALGTTPANIASINDNGTKFAFDGLNLSVGTPYTVKFYGENGEDEISTRRFRVAAMDSSKIAPFVISGITAWSPLCLISGTFEAELPVYNATVTAEGITWDTELPETLASGTTLNISGTGAVGALSVPAEVTANLSGDLSVTLTNNGEVNILSGVCEVTRGSAQSIKGTVNIAKNATFKSLSGDAVAYNGGTTINVYGTLDMGTTRWTVGGSSVINCYGGCTVTADDTNTRAIDLFRSGTIITVNKVEGESTTVSLPSISPRNTDGSTIEIANGMTLMIEKPIAYSDATDGLVKIAGAGKLGGTISLKDGVALDLGSTNGQIAKFVSESGVNTLKWTGNGNAHICDNDSAESPFVTVNSGATLKIHGKDFSGWNGGLTEHGWILNNGNLVFTNGDGSRFWREHIVFADGSTMSIDHGGRALLMYGGAGTADACQFMLPSGTATIAAGAEGEKAVLYFGNDGSGGWGDDDAAKKATGFSVGAGAALTVSAPIQGNQAISKYGAGTLVFSDATASTYSGSVTLNAGTIKSATTLTVSAPEGYTLNTDTESEEGVTIYTLTRTAGQTIYVTSNTSTFVDAEGNSITPIAADTIVVDSHCTIGQWGGGINISQLPACAELVLNRHMDAQGGIAAGSKVEVSYKEGNDKGIYLRGDIGEGATITGEGNLFVGHANKACSVGNGVSIACNFGIQSNQVANNDYHDDWVVTINGTVTVTGTIYIHTGNFKLADDASLVTTQLDEDTEAKIIPGVSGKHVEYLNNAYVLVADAPTSTRPTDIEGGSQAQRDAFDAWADGKTLEGVAESHIVNAFILDQDVTATEEELKELVGDEITADMVAGLADGTIKPGDVITIEAYPNATFKFVTVPTTEIDTTASLFRLEASFVPAN